MIRKDEDALICDLAQYYNIYDWRAHKVQYIAILACGLPAESRMRKIVSGQNFSPDTIMLAAAVDYLAFLAWSKTRDAQKGRNRPKSLSKLFGNTDNQQKKECRAYDSAEDFEKALAEAKEKISGF